MNLIVRNVSFSVSLSLTLLKLAGWWMPQDGLSSEQKIWYKLYAGFTFMFVSGITLITQAVDLFMVWGNLLLMTGTSFLLFTNLAHAGKVLNVLYKRDRIGQIANEADLALRSVNSREERDIVRRCNTELVQHQVIYVFLTFITTVGLFASAEKGRLPLRAWYPYDTSKSPAYEISYCHQLLMIALGASLNIAKDTLVTSLIGQCRCRLKLIGLSLRRLGDGLRITEKHRLTPSQERILSARLRSCIARHQATLSAVLQLQACFSAPTFAQFTVSLVIICVSAFQMVSLTSNMVRLLSMTTYILNMMFQVFIYCYHGHCLSQESSEIAGAAYECEWYRYSVRLRRSLLVVMTRTQRVAKLTAGGFTTLSLASFMGIIKASYSMFTLLRQVDAKN